MSLTIDARTIIIIDDDEAVRDSTRMLLEGCGYVVRDHASAESFLVSDSGEANCLLVDQHMPGMTGVELLELLHVRSDPPPALIVTGRSDRAIEARLADIGVKLLCKPVVDDLLIDSIEEACRTSKRVPAVSKVSTPAPTDDPLDGSRTRSSPMRKDD